MQNDNIPLREAFDRFEEAVKRLVSNAKLQCDVPNCPYAAEVTKVSQADEEIHLCRQHQDLTPAQVIEQHNIWLQSL